MPHNPTWEYEVILNTERRTYAPGDDIWIAVELKLPQGKRAPIEDDAAFYGGSVGLVGEERVTLPGGSSKNSSIFEPILVYLEPSAPSTMWRVRLKLPKDIPPSCDLGAIPPCGLVLYVVTARLQIPGSGSSIQPFFGSKRIRVVSSPQMGEMKAADVASRVVDNLSWRLWCCSTPSAAKALEPGAMKQHSHNRSLGTLRSKNTSDYRSLTSFRSKNTPEFRVEIPHKTSFRCGEHLKYRVTVRGDGPNGRSTVRKFSRVDALRVWIRRERWFSDGRSEAVQTDIAKHPQIVDFTGSAAGVLPVDFDGSISVPLGIAPTTRGSFLTNEYDLVVEILIAGRECGMVEIPITIWRDVEGNFRSPAFSPNLRAIKFNMDSTHGGDGTADDEEEVIEGETEGEVHGGANMQKLALA